MSVSYGGLKMPSQRSGTARRMGAKVFATYRCDQNHGQCLHFKIVYYSRSRIATDSLQDLPLVRSC